MPSDWKTVPLSHLIEIKHGYAFPGDGICTEQCKNILVTPGNFSIGGGFKGDKFKYFSGDVPEDYVLQAGDLLVTMTDLSKQSDTLGYPALVPESGGNRFLHNQRIGKVLIKGDVDLDKSFLYYLLHSLEYRNEVLASATGTSIKHTSPGRILAYKATIPPPAEQRKIADFLGAIDKKIETNYLMIDSLDEMMKTIFESWFVDFAPVRARAGKRSAGLPESVSAVFPETMVTSMDGEVPDGWKLIPLYEISTFVNGAAYKDIHFSPNDEGLPVVKIAELKSGVTDNTRFTSANLGEKYLIDSGEILFSWSGNPDTSIDTFLWAGGPAWLNQHIFRVRENGVASRPFIYSQLKALRPIFAEIARNKQTTGLGHVTVADMKRLMVCMPSKEAADAFDRIVTPFFERIDFNQRQIRSLGVLRSTLLPKLISGEIRVPSFGMEG